MKRARSDSYCGSATISPSTTAKCAAHTCGSSRERRRRVATSAPNSATIFGLDEHLGEGRMGVVGGRRRQHQFGVGGELDLARTATAVGQATRGGPRRRPRPRRELPCVVVNAPSRRMNSARSSPKTTSSSVRAASDWLRAGGPDSAALRIAQEDEGAPVVAGRVLPPPRHGDVAPAAVARARSRSA